MLADFVRSHRDQIVERARERVSTRTRPKVTELELTSGIPVFLDQLCESLRLAESNQVVDHRELGRTAGQHGLDLLQVGMTIGQVVHDYGDVCQTITELAVEQNLLISATSFKNLNLCLDNAIAEAVTLYTVRRDRTVAEQETERMGTLAHELRNLLNSAVLAFDMIKTGRVAPGGSTSLVVTRSLSGLRDLIDRSLANVRLDAGISHVVVVSVSELVLEVSSAAAIQAGARRQHLTAEAPDDAVTISADWQILAAALTNLLQNAFKFSPPEGHIALRAQASDERVFFEVEDECGGLPAGEAEDLFLPYSQRSADRSGIGLGLAICRRAAESNGGELRVRNLPGKGCVFTLDLRRHGAPTPEPAPKDADPAAVEASSLSARIEPGSQH